MPADPVVRHPQERSRLCRDSVRVYAVACCCFNTGPAIGALVGALMAGGLRRSGDDPGFDPARRIPLVHWLFDRLPRTQWLFWSSLAGVAAFVPLLYFHRQLSSDPAMLWWGLEYPFFITYLLLLFGSAYAVSAWLLACLRLWWERFRAMTPSDLQGREFEALHRMLGASLIGTVVGWEFMQMNSTMRFFVRRFDLLAIPFPDLFDTDWSVAYVCCRWCCQLCFIAVLLGCLVGGGLAHPRLRAGIGVESPQPGAAWLAPGWRRPPRVFATSLLWVWAASVPLVALLAGMGERAEPLLIVGDSLRDHQRQYLDLNSIFGFSNENKTLQDPAFLKQCPGCGNSHPDRFPQTAQVVLLLAAPALVVAAWMLARIRLARRPPGTVDPGEFRALNHSLGWSLFGMLLGIRWMQLTLSLFGSWR